MPQRYEKPEGDPHLGEGSARDLEALENHIRRWWGDVPEVFHEVHSEYVHIDLHLVPATAERPFHVVVTTGMSDRAMVAPDGTSFYCELVLALPSDWPMRKPDINDERVWWPFRQLKSAARFPHAYNTVLWLGHTLANGDPPRPFHETAAFCGGILSIPMLCPREAWSLPVRQDKEVFFFSFVPLFENELRFAWEKGSQALFKKLDRIKVTELVRPGRKCAV